jgi:hypothetical protein
MACPPHPHSQTPGPRLREKGADPLAPRTLLDLIIRAVAPATVLCVAFTASATPRGNLIALKSIIPAQTFEQVRTKTKQGYGAKIHGRIKINGKSFDFVSGGRGRGSAPFGTYRMGPLSGFRAPKGTWVPGYRLSDAYDPFVKDRRTGLFIHPGHDASAGCVAIRKDQWSSFVSTVGGAAKVGRLAIRLGSGSESMEETPSSSIVKFARHKRSAGRRSRTIKIHFRSGGRTHRHRKV